MIEVSIKYSGHVFAFSSISRVFKEVLPDQKLLKWHRNLQKKVVTDLTEEEREVRSRKFYKPSQHLIMGTNQVTKAIEKKGGISLILVCELCYMMVNFSYLVFRPTNFH